MGQQPTAQPKDGPTCQLVTGREATHMGIAEGRSHIGYRFQLPTDMGLQAEGWSVQDTVF